MNKERLLQQFFSFLTFAPDGVQLVGGEGALHVAVVAEDEHLPGLLQHGQPLRLRERAVVGEPLMIR